MDQKMNDKLHERRYKTEHVQLTFWQSLFGLIRGHGWNTEEFQYIEISPDSPEWDDAPFATSYITMGSWKQ